MHLRPYMLLLLIFLFLALAPAHAVAAGQVSGGILYGAGQYRAEVDGKEVQKVTSQYGQVSLDYRAKNGLPRLGNYTLMLGYEFNVLDPTFTDYGIKDPAVGRIETGKVLYQGEILLAPGGLPFRLNAYARDTDRSSFESAGGRRPDLPIGLQGGQLHSQGPATLLAHNINTDIEDGSHHEVGVTLLVGIRNGSYLGNYRNVLSQLPRLLIDYKQILVRDLARDSNQQHYRQRDLAFISLNKKDNWVHFRTQDYKNFLDDSQDSEAQQVMIGTIDPLLSRQWINLTNWIKISGDLAYTVTKIKSEEFSENTYTVNLFATVRRQEFKSSILSSFERETQGARLSQDIELPVYFNYEPNRESYYRGSLRGNFSRQSVLEGLSSATNAWQSSRRDVTFDLGSEFFRTRAIVFKPRIIFGVTGDDDSQGLNEKLTLEWSNSRGKRSLPWTAGYDIASTQTSTDNSSSLYLEQSLYGNVEKNLSRAMRVGLRGTVRQGRGQRGGNGADGVSNRVELGATGTGFDKAELNRFLFYHGQVFWEHAGALFSNRLELTVEGIKVAADSLTSTEVQHQLKTAGRKGKFSLISALSRGSSVKVQSINTEYVPEESTRDGATYGWSSKAEYSYEPDRRLRLTLSGSIKGLSGDRGDYTAWLGKEKLEYSFYRSNGIVRKIAEISEEFGAEGSSNGFSGRNRTTFLRVKAAIYPNKYVYAKVDTELEMFNPSGAEQVTLNAETGANFQKMQVALSYGHGYKAAEGLLAEVKEERWDVKVRKTF